MSTEYKCFTSNDGYVKTGFYAKIENGKVTEIVNTSTNEDHWWNRIDPPYHLVGKSGKELSEVMDHYFDGYDNPPYISKRDLSEEEYEWETRNKTLRDPKYKYLKVSKSDDSAYTDLYVKIEDGKVTEIIDDSKDAANWEWNMEKPPYEMIGEGYYELIDAIKHEGYSIWDYPISRQQCERRTIDPITQDGVVYKSFRAAESDFGASTSFCAKIENGKVTEIVNTSTNKTHYGWDIYPPYEMVGKSSKELLQLMDQYYDNYKDDYRHPWIAERNLSKEEYEGETRNETRRNPEYKYLKVSKRLGDSILNHVYTDFYVKIESDKVVEFIDASLYKPEGGYNTAYREKLPYDMVGKSYREVSEAIRKRIDEGYSIWEKPISRQRYERVRASAAQGKDKFAEREAILRVATERVLARHECNKRELETAMMYEKSTARRLKDQEDLLAKSRKGEVSLEERYGLVFEARPNRRTLRSRRRIGEVQVKEESKLTKEEKQAKLDEALAREISKLRDRLKEERKEVSKARNEVANLDKKIATARVAAAKKHIKESR